MPQPWQTSVEAIPAQVTILKSQTARLINKGVLMGDRIVVE